MHYIEDACSHAHARSLTRVYTHEHAHGNKLIYRNLLTLIHAGTIVYTHTHTHSHACSFARPLVRTLSHTNTHAHIHAYTQNSTHARAIARALTWTLTYTCIHTRTHTHLFMHTQTHIQYLEYFHYYLHCACETFREKFFLSFLLHLVHLFSADILVTARRSSEWCFNRTCYSCAASNAVFKIFHAYVSPININLYITCLFSSTLINGQTKYT